MHYLKKLALPLAMALALANISLPNSARAQTYPIDCAILLCLSGGWPASAPCSRARAEFIRRITPWPVEPPLQIWRCPMGAAYEGDQQLHPTARVFDVLHRDSNYRPRFPFPEVGQFLSTVVIARHSKQFSTGLFQLDFALLPAQERADIDISGPEFNFVRSIRVFDVRYARQQESGQDDDCNRSALVVLGTYGIQGDFAWQRSSLSALPAAHIGVERWGDDCPNINHRSVFVDWRDFEGNYGFEQVNY